MTYSAEAEDKNLLDKFGVKAYTTGSYNLNFRSKIGSNPVNMRARAFLSVWLIGDYFA